jgi:hypothetical protein
MLAKAAKPQTQIPYSKPRHHAFQGVKVSAETRIMVHNEGFQEFMDFVD